MWAILFIGLLLLGIGGLFFLIYSAGKFRFVTVLVHGRRAVCWGIGAVLVLIPTAVLWAAWGSMNAMIVVLLHLAIFWAVAELVQSAVQKRRNQVCRCYYAGMFALLVTVLYLGTGWIQAYHVWQTDYTVTTEKKCGNIACCNADRCTCWNDF